MPELALFWPNKNTVEADIFKKSSRRSDGIVSYIYNDCESSPSSLGNVRSSALSAIAQQRIERVSRWSTNNRELHEIGQRKNWSGAVEITMGKSNWQPKKENYKIFLIIKNNEKRL